MGTDSTHIGCRTPPIDCHIVMILNFQLGRLGVVFGGVGKQRLAKLHQPVFKCRLSVEEVRGEVDGKDDMGLDCGSAVIRDVAPLLLARSSSSGRAYGDSITRFPFPSSFPSPRFAFSIDALY